MDPVKDRFYFAFNNPLVQQIEFFNLVPGDAVVHRNILTIHSERFLTRLLQFKDLRWPIFCADDRFHFISLSVVILVDHDNHVAPFMSRVYVAMGFHNFC